jgi:predicted nuclease of predicted toxin-antitoxin system
LRLLLDHGSPASVSAILLAGKHKVVLASDILPNDTPDAVIWKICDDDEQVFVTLVDPGKTIKLASGPPRRQLLLQCGGFVAAHRVQMGLPFIEAEHELSEKHRQRMQLVFTDTSMKTFR